METYGYFHKMVLETLCNNNNNNKNVPVLVKLIDEHNSKLLRETRTWMCSALCSLFKILLILPGGAHDNKFN